MADFKKIGNVQVVTDCETGMYKIGEVSASFNEKELKDHIEKHGHEGLCAQLAFMQFQVWETLRTINSDKSKDEKVVGC
jgi:hypothetical protein